MWPTLLSFGPIAVHSFGVMIFLGIFVGGFVWWQKGREENFDEEPLMDVLLSSLIVSMIVGRVWYLFSNWSQFAGSFYKMIFITKFPGISYEGVVLGGVLSLGFFAYKKSFDVWKILDLSVLSLLVIEIFAYGGSFLAGSNLGTQTNLFFGVPFPGIEGKRYPVQLVFVLLLGGLYKLFKKLEKEYRNFKWYSSSKGEAKPGFMIGSYLIGLGLVHTVLGFISEVNNLYFSFGMVFLGVLLLVVRSGIKMKSREPKKVVEVKVETHRKLKKRKKKGFDFK
jgi:prolipoprotein diacylglyceryltransferase